MTTPCEIKNDTPDKNGNYFSCPFADSYMGYEDEMCRNCCGLGVDEDSYDDYAEEEERYYE